MKSVVPFSKFLNSKSNFKKHDNKKKKNYLLNRIMRNRKRAMQSFLLLLKSKNAAIIRVRRNLNIFRSCNLYNSVSQYSQSSISLSSCYGFFQQRKHLNNKLYRVCLTGKKNKKKIYAIAKTKKKKKNNTTKEKNFHKKVIENSKAANLDIESDD